MQHSNNKYSQPSFYPLDNNSMAPFQLTLQDGEHMLLRAIAPDDWGHLQKGMAALSSESRYFRFFTPVGQLNEQMLSCFCSADQHDHVACAG